MFFLGGAIHSASSVSLPSLCFFDILTTRSKPLLHANETASGQTGSCAKVTGKATLPSHTNLGSKQHVRKLDVSDSIPFATTILIS